MRRKFDNEDDYFFNSEITGGNGILPFNQSNDSDDSDSDFDDEPEACWMFDTISAIMTMDKPFGMLFTMDKIEKFLKDRGYSVEERYFSHLNDTMKVATKEEGDIVDIVPDSPEGATKYHIRGIFASEVQDIILAWLLKLGKKK